MMINTILQAMTLGTTATAVKKEHKNENGEKNMSNDVRIVKFKKIIEKIWEDLDRTSLIEDNKIASKDDSVFLATIYDYNKLNEYGKVIMDQVSGKGRYKGYYQRYENIEYRLDQAEWVTHCIHSGSNNFYRQYIFIFWALMILAVDDSDKETHLSLICDFAKMLNIDNCEMMDMVHIVRLVFNKEVEGFLASSRIRICFERLLKDFRFQEKPISSVEEGLSRMGSIMGGLLR